MNYFEGHQALGSRSFVLGCSQVQRENQGCELQGNRLELDERKTLRAIRLF